MKNSKPKGSGWRRLWCDTCHKAAGWYRPRLVRLSTVLCETCSLHRSKPVN